MDTVTIIVAMLVAVAIALAVWLSAKPSSLVCLSDDELLALVLLFVALDAQ
jgi:hypothetical protein